MKYMEKHTQVLIIRMRHVPIIDATGIQTLREVYADSIIFNTKIILSEVHSRQVLKELQDARLIFAIGKRNIADTFDKALERSESVVNEE